MNPARSASADSTAPDVLSRIRDETRASHERLEATVDLTGRIRSTAEYRRLLVSMYGYYRPLEERLAAIDWSGTGIDFEERRKLARLEGDLVRLGVPAAGLDLLPRSRQAPRPRGRAAAFGCLYVLEGATLGGQIIARHVREHLDGEAGAALSFYGGYGPRTGALWRSFREALRASCADEASAVEAAAAAVATFEGLENWLTRRWPSPV